MIGKTISHYRVLSALGAGGMGVVYEAEDVRLGRRVAIKMLPDGLESRPDVVERFRREARSASALNHPNICTIYEIDEHEGQQFIVMELLVGQTLAHKIGNRPLKAELILEYATQIADALDAAHSQGIIHRDIKSSNIFVTERGQAKVLDFGLAKLEEKAVGSYSKASTLSVPQDATRPGTTLGTLLYMSPEQARGDELDARSDVFSFGVVLYEMATGTLPFQGSSQAVIFSQILEKQPVPALRLNPRIPLRLDEVILKALEKDRTLRYQSAAELRADLKRLRRDSESSHAVAGAAPASANKRWLRYGLSASGLLLLALLAFFHPWKNQTPAVGNSQWVQLTNFVDSVSSPALSPDGRMLTFVRGPDTFITPGQIWVKLLPNGAPKQLTTDGLLKMGPAFSPDGSQITYTAVDPTFAWHTYSVPVLGGEAQRLLPNAAGLTWIGDHGFLFSEIKSGINMALVTAGESRMGERTIYDPPTARGMAHRSALSPDGRSVTLAEMDNSGWQQCRLVPFDGSSAGAKVGPPKSKCTYVAWSPDGRWMYFSANAGDGFHLWRQRFPDGAPQQITFGPTEQEGITVSADGKSLITAAGIEESALWLHDESGDRQISSEGYASSPSFSPDGKKLFFVVLDYTVPVQGFTSGHLQVAELENGRLSEVVPDVRISGYDVSSDGKQVVFAAYDEKGVPHIWQVPVDHSLPPRQLFAEEGDQPLFAPGGVVYYRSRQGGVNQISRYKPDGSRQIVHFQAIHELGGISPDGQWISAWGQDPADPTQSGYFAIATSDGHARRVCDECAIYWTKDGRNLVLISDTFSVRSPKLGKEATVVIPLKPNQDLPDLPPGGWRDAKADLQATMRTLPGVLLLAPGGSRYAFERRSAHRNLYRVPLD